MKLKDLIGMDIIDEAGNTVGNVSNIDINENTGSIKGIDVGKRKGILSHNEKLITFNQINQISDKILLDNILCNDNCGEP
ncbi:PRC-barrel domain protein [Methanobrevibacter cuticularis]|uniref:PRC-barrel domain protein n=1 Tax=Methanobrevibacter cuticularis TaxID=47311 RepID=A0A166FGT6_9EURY|nr:PRC-barrel domain-containing protein [Methanobrevibacter cuticularis]KZX17658.1 PRC-barrel domain protein [Methanobrevibacter cuticularis]